MYLMPLLATLMSSVFCGALPMVSRNLGHRGVTVFSIFSLTIAFLSSAAIWIDLYIGGSPVWLDLFGAWLEVGTVSVSWIFYYDLLTAHMLFTVTSVSLAVHIYATVYMRSDPHLSLFMSYLSLFTFFMLVYVCSDNLLGMMVGWEGNLHHCLNGIKNRLSLKCTEKNESNSSMVANLAVMRSRSKVLHHSHFFNQIMVGFLLGDGWLEKRGNSIRLGISLAVKFKDVAQMYKLWFYGLGYIPTYHLALKSKNQKYYQIRTGALYGFRDHYDSWYSSKPWFSCQNDQCRKLFPGIDSTSKWTKRLPVYLGELFTPLVIAIWLMGDGSGMLDGGFKISTHSFSLIENQYLCDLFEKHYKIKANVLMEKKKRGGQYYYIRIWKRSLPKLIVLVKPYFKESCFYKFKHVK